eukprot:14967214-Alexandrium_andersonii.AAC.1
MSASLVGSEMCIRDRNTRRVERQTPREADPWSARGWGGALCAARGGSAVSYTHLTLPTICSV